MYSRRNLFHVPFLCGSRTYFAFRNISRTERRRRRRRVLLGRSLGYQHNSHSTTLGRVDFRNLRTRLQGCSSFSASSRAWCLVVEGWRERERGRTSAECRWTSFTHDHQSYPRLWMYGWAGAWVEGRGEGGVLWTMRWTGMNATPRKAGVFPFKTPREFQMGPQKVDSPRHFWTLADTNLEGTRAAFDLPTWVLDVRGCCREKEQDD